MLIAGLHAEGGEMAVSTTRSGSGRSRAGGGLLRAPAVCMWAACAMAQHSLPKQLIPHFALSSTSTVRTQRTCGLRRLPMVEHHLVEVDHCIIARTVLQPRPAGSRPRTHRVTKAQPARGRSLLLKTAATPIMLMLMPMPMPTLTPPLLAPAARVWLTET